MPHLYNLHLIVHSYQYSIDFLGEIIYANFTFFFACKDIALVWGPRDF